MWVEILLMIQLFALSFFFWFFKVHLQNRIKKYSEEYGQIDAKIERIKDIVTIESSIHQEKTLVTEAAKVYTEFLKTLADATAEQKSNYDNKDKSSDRDLLEGRLRICVYGSAEVVTALAELDRLGATLDSAEAIKAFIKMVQAMRKHAANLIVPDTDICFLLLDSEIKDLDT